MSFTRQKALQSRQPVPVFLAALVAKGFISRRSVERGHAAARRFPQTDGETDRDANADNSHWPQCLVSLKNERSLPSAGCGL
jgi:hypothetical protein